LPEIVLCGGGGALGVLRGVVRRRRLGLAAFERATRLLKARVDCVRRRLAPSGLVAQTLQPFLGGPGAAFQIRRAGGAGGRRAFL
jgi:hypothetical protein